MQERLTESARIVLAAREFVGETQREFAARLGTAQSLICKYERGDVSPPAKILIHCMNLTEKDEKTPGITADELAALVKRRLGGAQMGQARQAVAKLIECLPPVSRRAQGGRGGMR